MFWKYALHHNFAIYIIFLGNIYIYVERDFTIRKRNFSNEKCISYNYCYTNIKNHVKVISSQCSYSGL